MSYDTYYMYKFCSYQAQSVRDERGFGPLVESVKNHPASVDFCQQNYSWHFEDWIEPEMSDTEIVSQCDTVACTEYLKPTVEIAELSCGIAHSPPCRAPIFWDNFSSLSASGVHFSTPYRYIIACGLIGQSNLEERNFRGRFFSDTDFSRIRHNDDP